MATFQVFDQARIDCWLAVHNLPAHTLKMGHVSSAQAVAQNDAAPRWSGGGTNYSANQVFGGNVPTGGNTLTSVTVAGDPTTLIDAADITINQNASNPNNVRRSILYNDSDTSKRAIGFVDWGADQDLSAGNNTIDTSNGFFDLVGN
jgi:hypothetical protein